MTELAAARVHDQRKGLRRRAHLEFGVKIKLLIRVGARLIGLDPDLARLVIDLLPAGGRGDDAQQELGRHVAERHLHARRRLHAQPARSAQEGERALLE